MENKRSTKTEQTNKKKIKGRMSDKMPIKIIAIFETCVQFQPWICDGNGNASHGVTRMNSGSLGDTLNTKKETYR